LFLIKIEKKLFTLDYIYIHFFDFFELLLADFFTSVTFLTGSSLASFLDDFLVDTFSTGFSSVMLDFLELFGLSALATFLDDLVLVLLALSIIP
jgi:hypothetical protein